MEQPPFQLLLNKYPLTYVKQIVKDNSFVYFLIEWTDILGYEILNNKMIISQIIHKGLLLSILSNLWYWNLD